LAAVRQGSRQVGGQGRVRVRRGGVRRLPPRSLARIGRGVAPLDFREPNLRPVTSRQPVGTDDLNRARKRRGCPLTEGRGVRAAPFGPAALPYPVSRLRNDGTVAHEMPVDEDRFDKDALVLATAGA